MAKVCYQFIEGLGHLTINLITLNNLNPFTIIKLFRRIKNMTNVVHIPQPACNQISMQSQELLATLALQELAQEEEPTLTKMNKMNTVRQTRYYSNNGLNSWSGEFSSSHLNPKQQHKSIILPFRAQKQPKHRKPVRRLYQYTSTTLLELEQPVAVANQTSKRQLVPKNRPKTRINQFSHNSDKNKLLLIKRFKKERAFLNTQFLPHSSFEEAPKNNEPHKSKNKESSAIKKIKCDLIQKSKFKSDAKLSVCDLDTSKLRFSLQPKQQDRIGVKHKSGEGSLSRNQRKEHIKRNLAKTIYSLSMRDVRKDSIKSINANEVRKNPEIGLTFSQQFKILVNLLKRQNANEIVKK